VDGADRGDADAGYVAWDWTDKLRTAFRGEFFSDPMGSRTGAGQKVDLWEMTATLSTRSGRA
jgi:hypothetical protein